LARNFVTSPNGIPRERILRAIQPSEREENAWVPASYPGVSNVSEKRRKKRPMSSSRNGTWEGLALAQRTLGRLKRFPCAQSISSSILNPLERAWVRGSLGTRLGHLPVNRSRLSLQSPWVWCTLLNYTCDTFRVCRSFSDPCKCIYSFLSFI